MAQYLDPGSGSVVVQLLVAGLVGVGAVLRLYWNQIKARLRKRNPGEPPER